MQTETINRRDAEAQSLDRLSEQIIGACIEVHRALGPGLLESAYEECPCHELSLRSVPHERQVPLPVIYKGIKLDCGYRLDLVVAGKIVVELKAVETLMPVHDAQVLTYLKLTGKSVGLLVNFNVPMLKAGLKRIVHHYPDFSASPRLGGDFNL